MSAISYADRQAHFQSQSWIKWVIAFSAALGAILEVIDTSIVNVALTDMQASLGATLSEIGWVITSYAIANVIIIPLSAWLGDFYGKKRYFVFSMVGFVLASALCGMSHTLPMLIAARVLQGLTGGGLLAKAQTILFETFPPHEQGKAQALFGITVIMGPTIGPTLGGYIVTNFDWRWIFFINLPIGVIAVLMSMTFLPPDPEKRTVSSRVDWTGIALLAIGLGSLQWFLEKGNDEDWFESRLIAWLFVSAVVGLGLFVWRELTTSHPAVDLKVLRHKSLAAGSVYSVVLGISLYGAIFAVPIFAQSLLGYTAFQTGMLLLPGALAAAFMMPIMGKLNGKVDARILVVLGSLIVMGTMFALSGLTPQTGTESLFWPLLFRGAGTAMMFLPLTLATISPLPKQDIPSASGFFNLTRQMGGSIGIAMLTTLLDQRRAYHYSRLSEHISIYNPASSARFQTLTSAFMAKGADLATAQKQAIGVLTGTINLQSAVMSFADIFRIVAMMFVFTIPLIFLLGKGRGAEVPAEAH